MEKTLKEQSIENAELTPQELQEEILNQDNRFSPFSVLDERIQLALRCADDKKGIGITALDLRDITSFTEFFVIVSGLNIRQVQAISDDIEEKLKKELGTKALRIEGRSSAEWILMDYGDFIVHIFENKARDTYDLERLWRDSKKVELPKEL